MSSLLSNAGRAIAVAVLIAAAGPALAQGRLTTERPARGQADPMTIAAVDRLKAMSAVIGGAKSLSVTITSIYDEPIPSGTAIKRIAVHNLKIKRPDKLAFEAELDNGITRAGWFDGRKLVIASPTEKKYFEVPLSATVDELIANSESHGLTLPVADLFYSDVFAAQAPYLISGADLGDRKIGGELTRQIAFESYGSNWQLWLSTGDRPVPERFVAVYVRQIGDPEFMATFDKWSFADLPDSDFEPKIGADWTKIDQPGSQPAQ